MANVMVSVSCNTKRTECTKAHGPTTCVTAKEWKGTPTETSTKETSKTTRRTAKEFTPGPTEKSMTASGELVSRKATESGKVYLAILTLASGSSPRLKGTEYISGRMETSSKASGRTA